MSRTGITCVRFLGFVLALLSTVVSAGENPVIAAASSVKYALEEISEKYRSDTGQSVRLTFGSSGNIYRQIMQSAPFEVFLSADETYILELEQANKTVGNGVLYANGRIVLFVPHGSTFSVDEQANGLKTALKEEQLQRFSIANPAHAPYGRAAKEALQSLSLWANIQAKLVLGENISQATQFAISGSTQGGIFAYSLALTPGVKKRGQFIQLPEHLHQPINHRMALIKNASEAARRFYHYLQQPLAQNIFKQYGFGLTNE